MRIRDLRPGRWYAAKHGIKRACELVVLLLDVEPWHRDYDGTLRPRDARPVRRGEIRSVPVVRLEPIVWLADGTEHHTEWSWDLHVPGLLGPGWRDAGRVEVASMAVRARPDLLVPTLIDHPLPTPPGVPHDLDASWAFGWFEALRLGIGPPTPEPPTYVLRDEHGRIYGDVRVP